MLHLRIIVPSQRRPEVERLLQETSAVTHVAVLPGAARQPPGDLVLADVVREGASDVLSGLRGLGLDRDGAIMMETVDVSLSRYADRAARQTPGLGVDAVVWEEIEHRTGEETELSVSFLASSVDQAGGGRCPSAPNTSCASSAWSPSWRPSSPTSPPRSSAFSCSAAA